VEPLAGWRIAVTADRRAEEQAQMLASHGATVLATRLVTTAPCDEDELRGRTEALLADPPDVVVANTAVGMRTWIALAWSWGIGADLLVVLQQATVVARGSKATAALLTEDVPVAWRSAAETLDDVGDHLIARGVVEKRIALQLDGRLDEELASRLRASGADVVELPVYRVTPEADGVGARRLVSALAVSDVDAVTFTTPAAVDAYAALGADPSLAHVCVGPVTGAAAQRHGLVAVIVPTHSRLGPMVRALATVMAERSRTVALAGHAVRIQGSAVAIDDRRVQLTPRERAVLEALVDARGAVVSKAALARTAWVGDVDEHAVEVAVNRLRRKLGPAAGALETTNRRGYRLILDRPLPHQNLA
jgi:uroporphyrinogen-III synthase